MKLKKSAFFSTPQQMYGDSLDTLYFRFSNSLSALKLFHIYHDKNTGILELSLNSSGILSSKSAIQESISQMKITTV